MASLDAAVRGAQDWARDEFGPDADPDAVARKVLEEARELADDPTDHSEMADVVVGIARLADVCDVDLAAAIEVVVGRNREREWVEDPETGNWGHL